MDQHPSNHYSKLNFQNHLYVLAVGSVLLIAFDVAIKQSIHAMWAEIFILFGSILTLVIEHIYKKKNQIPNDQPANDTLLKIYRTGFIIISVLTFFIYFGLTRFEDVLFITVSDGSFNLLVLLIILYTFIELRKHNLTFNYKIIDAPRGLYYRIVFKRIGYMFGLYILVSVLFYFVSLLQGMLWIVLGISLGMTYVSFSLIYLMISIYERIHVAEQQKMNHGTIPYVSYKAYFLIVAVLIFAVINQIPTFINDAISINLIPSNPHTPGVVLLPSLIIRLFNIDFIFVMLIANLVIYGSLKKANRYNPNYLTVFKIGIWLNFFFQFLFSIYTIVVTFYPIPVFLVDLTTLISLIFLILYYIQLVLALGMGVTILIFMHHYAFPGSNLFLIKLILSLYPVASILVLYVIRPSEISDMNQFLFYNHIGSFIIGTIMLILILKILKLLSHKDLPMNPEAL